MVLRGQAGWRLDALGAVREVSDGASLTGDLYRASLAWSGPSAQVAAGRLVLPGERGFLRLDGAMLAASLPRSLSARVWAGRSWHPESWSDQPLRFGAEIRSGGPKRASGTAGWEVLSRDGRLEHRLHAFGALRSPRGGHGAALLELAPAETPLAGALPPARLMVGGTAPLGAGADLGAEARWEGLPPVEAPVALSSPLEWLAGTGYATAELSLTARVEHLAIRARGGPTARADGHPELGGSGRLAAEWSVRDDLTLGLRGVAATIDPSWIAGGVLGARWRPEERVRLGLETGWFRFHPMTGSTSHLLEARLAGTAELAPGLTVTTEVVGGADRVLAPWIRGGLSLRVTQGTGRLP